MACKHWIYPEIWKMKLDLAELSGRMKANLTRCVTSTNLLIDCIEEHLPGRKFEKIILNTSDSVESICILLKNRTNEVKEYIVQKEYEVRELLGTEMFNKLVDPCETISRKYEIACMVADGVTLMSVAGIFLVGMVMTWKIWNYIDGMLLVGGGSMFVSIVIGKWEKAHLEQALKESTNTVLDFEDASSKFCENVTRVKVMIEFRIHHIEQR